MTSGPEKTPFDQAAANALLRGQASALEKALADAPLGACLAALTVAVETAHPSLLASILLFDEATQTLQHGAAPSLPESYNAAVHGLAIGENQGSCGTAAWRRVPVIVTDIATDPLWSQYRELALPHDLRACWSYPILEQGDLVLGTFAIYYRTPRAPTQLDLAIIASMVSTAAVLIRSRRTAAALKTNEARLRD